MLKPDDSGPNVAKVPTLKVTSIEDRLTWE